MLRNKKIIGFAIISVVIFLLAGCYKDKTILFDTGEEITRTVSFSNDIIPIFNNSCNSSGCHNTGGISPDLSGTNAFTMITTGGYLNVSSAESSELYLWMAGKKGTPMPVSGINKDYNALILAWIKQGANNN